VRVLAADLGEALGGGAHLRGLRRTRVGSFGVDEAHTLGVLGPAHVLPPAQALRDLPQIELDAEMARSVSHGLALDRVSVGAAGDGPWALLDRRGDLLAVYEGTGTDRMVAMCVLAGNG
jgi:tRNA pseudouridine55 synthase